jgi:Common central domain of tyrosinase
MAHRKDVSSLNNAQLSELRTLLDTFINKPADNPVAEHKAAGMDMTLMIHDQGFLTWHQHFIAELETWLVNNGGAKFVPLPYWNPAKPIPNQLDNNNTNVNLPLPANLKPAALKTITSYLGLNTRVVPYHNAVHMAAGGQMPNAETSPGDPIFWPFHAFLVAVYERWRNL